MRKNVMHSLLAVTSSSMSKYAEANLTSKIDTTATNWSIVAGTKNYPQRYSLLMPSNCLLLSFVVIMSFTLL